MLWHFVRFWQFGKAVIFRKKNLRKRKKKFFRKRRNFLSRLKISPNKLLRKNISQKVSFKRNILLFIIQKRLVTIDTHFWIGQK